MKLHARVLVPVAGAFAVASALACWAGDEKKPGEKPATDESGLAGLVKVDEWNPLVKDKTQGDGKPCRGGSIRVGSPSDPKSLQPIIDNDQPTRIVQEYLDDVLIDRDRETFEWLPMLVRYWKTRDFLFLKDGKRLEGRVVEETPDKVVFAEGVSRWTVARCDVDADEAAGKVTFKKDRPGGAIAVGAGVNEPKANSPHAEAALEGRISTWPGGRYTWYVDEKPKKTVEVGRSQIADVEEEVDGKKTTVPGVLREVVWDVFLRSGIRWHDGQPLTVDDVLFTWDTIMNPAVLSGPTRSYLVDLHTPKKISDDGLRFELKRQYFKAIGTIGGVLGAYVIPKHRYQPEKFKGDPKGFGEFFNKHPDNFKLVGMGPYRFSRFEPGKLVEVVRNDDWWGSKAQVPWIDPLMPYLDKIVWVTINNKNARLKALMKGEIDVDFDIEQLTWQDPDTKSEEFAKKFVRAKYLSPGYVYIGWNLRRPAGDKNPIFFGDKRVRLALTMLIDQKKILDNIHYGLGEPCTGPNYKYSPHSARREPIEYNPEKAKALLDEAGWIDHDGDGIRDKDGVKFEFTYSIHTAREYHLKIAEIVKQDIEKAGIKMVIKPTDFNSFIEVVNSRKFDAMRFAWGEPDCVDTDPYQIWHSSQWVDNGSNHTGYSNAEVDEILEKVRRELDFKKRARLLRKFDGMVYDEQPYTFLYYLYELYFYANRFRNVKFTVIGNTPYRLDTWFVPKELQGAE